MAESSQAGGAPTQAADEARAAEGAAQANTAGGPTDQDAMVDDEPGSLTIKESSREQSTATPAGTTDNPLDAPDAPRPEAEDADGQGDEEMTGMDAGEKAGAKKASKEPEAKDLETRSHLAVQGHAIIVPSYSQWFDMNSIDIKEKRALPEFFNGRNRSKTPAVYKDYRDFMINTYRLNPFEYLTVTACRRNLAGDVCAIMRVHAFLEQWGLINFQVDPEIRPSTIGPPFTGHFRITADTPRGLQPLQPAPGSTAMAGKPHPGTEKLLNQTPLPKSELNQKTRRDIYDANGKEATVPESKDKPANGEGAANGTPTPADVKALEAAHNEPAKLYTCYSCGVDCTRVRQHLSKPAPAAAGKPASSSGHDICMKCYMEGRFPASYTAADYIKLEDENYKALPDRNRPWTEQETLNLLEALELFDEDWNKVAEHVPGRTREECVMKFLQLEIEDNYLEADVPPSENGPMSLGYLREGRIPFSQADNPVLSVLGHLVTLADPHVTAAAAGKSIPEQMRILKRVMDKVPTASEAEKGKEKETEKEKTSDVKNEDAMDVDSAPSPQATEHNQVATTSSTSDHQDANPLATLPFALSAARSSALASHEERHITRLVSGAVNMQLQKLQLKLSQFNDFENLLSAERRDLERRRQQLFLDRLAFQKRVKGLEDVAKRVGQSLGGQPGLPGQLSTEDAVRALTEGIRNFGVGKGEEKGGVKRRSVEGGLVPLSEGAEGFGKLEV